MLNTFNEPSSNIGVTIMNTGMKQFLCKLIPPRPTFAQDMTEVERKIMQEHIIYWKDLSDRGIAIIFGPVLDPIGTWGVAIVEVASEPEAQILGRNDPAVQAGLTFEVYPMPGAIVRKSRTI
jgi:uncharacterized protein YciI